MHWNRKYRCHFKVDAIIIRVEISMKWNFVLVMFMLKRVFGKATPLIKSSSLIVNLFYSKMRLTKLKTLNSLQSKCGTTKRSAMWISSDDIMKQSIWNVPKFITNSNSNIWWCGRNAIWKWSAFSNAIKYNDKLNCTSDLIRS